MRRSTVVRGAVLLLATALVAGGLAVGAGRLHGGGTPTAAAAGGPAPPAPLPRLHLVPISIAAPPPPELNHDASLPPGPSPFRFLAPSVGIDLPVLSVGIDGSHAMEAPEGAPDDPVWHEAFWLRSGATPGAPGTATIAGHLDDTLGRPGGFWTLRNLQVGDVVEVVDTRPGAPAVRFRIAETHVYSYAEASTTSVLQRLYGEPGSADPVARLSLITCTGHFVRGSGYDHRFIAYAVRI